MTPDPKRVAPAADDWLARELRGFGPIGILAIAIILIPGNVTIGRMVALPVSALLVLVWAWRSHTPWAAIGYVRPRSWVAALACGAVFGSAFKIVMKMLVMPLFHADPVNQAYHFLTGNRALLPAAVWGMLVAGFGEETVFRGYLFERSARLFGWSATAKILTVVATSALFGLAHYADQGLAGVEQAVITGLVFGGVFARTRRIFPVMCAHASFDLTALGMIYWGLEWKVAHFVFR